MKTLQQTRGYETFSKGLVKQTAESLIEESQSGNVDTLSALAHIEFMSQVIEMAKEKLREQAVKILDLYGPEAKTGVVKHGVTFKHKESGVRYNYENTELWKDMKTEEDKLAASRKELEERLKTLKEKQTILNEHTGELIACYPPIKSSKTTVEISLSK